MEIRKLPPHPAPTKRLQVAAYVRVSRESERLSHSFSGSSELSVGDRVLVGGCG